MANVAPQSVFGANYAADNTNVTLPIAELPGVSVAEADSATGDARALLYGIVDRAETAYSSLDTAARPEKMSITRGAVQNISSGNGKIVVRESFTLTFEKEYMGADGELAAEN